jgi:hypothetical protein
MNGLQSVEGKPWATVKLLRDAAGLLMVLNSPLEPLLTHDLLRHPPLYP